MNRANAKVEGQKTFLSVHARYLCVPVYATQVAGEASERIVKEPRTGAGEATVTWEEKFLLYLYMAWRARRGSRAQRAGGNLRFRRNFGGEKPQNGVWRATLLLRAAKRFGAPLLWDRLGGCVGIGRAQGPDAT